MAALRAAAPLPLTGRYGPMARHAARGLQVWAEEAGVDLEIADCGEEPAAAAAAARRLAGVADILFGPYGSGAMRAVAGAFAGAPDVIWNHGGSAVPRTGARIVDVLGPAAAYWTGLPEALAAVGADPARVAVLRSAAGFGHEVGKGAVQALARAGASPVAIIAFDAGSAAEAATAAVGAGAGVVIACGRFEDDIALVRALAGHPVAVGAVAAGIGAAGEALGRAVAGLFGPAQWHGDPSVLPAGLRPAGDYPAVQAYAAGALALQAIAAAGSAQPDAVWDAARSLRTRTLLGPFAVDAEGRQTAHVPAIVRWVEGPGGPTRELLWRP